MASLSFGRTKRRLLSTFILALGLVVQPFSMVMANTAYAASDYSSTTFSDWGPFPPAGGGTIAPGSGASLAGDTTYSTVNGPVFTKWGGYENIFPDNGYYTSIDIYLDTNVALANSGKHFDFSSASNNVSGIHLRDFVFNVGADDGKWYITANTGADASSVINASTPGAVEVSASGWYTFHTDFSNNGGVLEVILSVYNRDTDEYVGDWTLSAPGDLIPSVVGGHRYGWFVNQPFPDLAVDNAELITYGPRSITNTTTNETFNTIQNAIDDSDTVAGDEISVGEGTYVENVVINKSVTLVGDGAEFTKIVATDGNATPLTFATNNATVKGFTLTHEYTSLELSNWGVNDKPNNNGVTFGQGTYGNTLEYSTITLNRNGVYMNNASATLSNNTITNNRTGINSTNTINGSTFAGNDITDNWTVGWVYYQFGPAMATDFSTLTVSSNTFDNWYSEVVIKNAQTSTGLVNVSNNTFVDAPVTRSTALTGTTTPSIDEPGLADQKPVALGGSATAPSHSIPTLRIYNSNGVTLAYTPASVAPGETLDLDVDSGSATTYNTVTLSSDGANPVVAVIPSGTVVTADPAWGGTVNTPTVTSFTTPGAFTTGLAITVGSNNYSLTFDHAVQLRFPGQAGKQVGFKAPGGNFTEITTVCNQSMPDQGDADAQLIGGIKECKMNFGTDLIVWTKHFTIFATFTPQTVSQGGNTSSTSTTRSGNVFSPTVYDDTWMDGANTKEGETFGEVKSNNVGVSGTATVSDDLQELPTNGISWYWWLLGGVLAAGAWSLVSLIRNGRFNR